MVLSLCLEYNRTSYNDIECVTEPMEALPIVAIPLFRQIELVLIFCRL